MRSEELNGIRFSRFENVDLYYRRGIETRRLFSDIGRNFIILLDI